MARRGSGGRQARHALRAAPPANNPAPPGPGGGQYTPLSPRDVTAIYDTACRLLWELGIGDVPDRLAELYAANGVPLREGRVHIPKALVESAIAAAPGRFQLHGRDPNRTIEVGGNSVHFGTGGAAVQTLDGDTGTYRSSTLQDLYDFTRVQDQLPNVSWFTRCCIATDMVGEYALDINTAYTLLRGTTKPVATAFTLAEHVAPIVAMMDMAEGTDGAFSKRPWMKAHISPMISPMRYGADAVAVTFECVAHNIPVSCITAAQSGATAPAALAGILAQSLAETLAALVMVHLMKPGYPMVFSNWPFVIDLRTGAFASAGGEMAVLNAASAQIINWLGLVSGVSAGMTDAKALDAQYGAEKGLTAMASALAGGNLIYESSGMTAALLGASLEGFVLDNEMHSHIYRTLRGIEVTDETLGFETICDAVRGEGHFLGHAATMASMERDYFYPDLADRDDPRAWADSGAQDAKARARAKVQALLAHHPDYLSRAADAKIRDAFKIELPPRP